MNRLRRTIAALAAALTFAAPTPGQGEEVEVEAYVTAVSGGSVYLDAGRLSGLEPGDAVRVFPTTGPFVTGEILSVSSNSARLRLHLEAEVEIGNLATVMVPADRLEPPEEDEPPPAEEESAEEDEPDVEHPPWTHPPVEWDETVPLLAPVQSREPEERSMDMFGSVHLGLNYTHDFGDVEQDFLWTDFGLRLGLENAFGYGGETRIDLNGFVRTSSLSDSLDESEAELVPRRLSYTLGGEPTRPNRYGFGRFLQHEFPELGLLDGFEYTRRLDTGGRVGASIGFQPLREDDVPTGDDFQVGVSYFHPFDAEERLTFATAFQKTWHQGTPDRDLVVSKLDLRPFDRAYLHVTTWVDVYSSSDDIKGSVELTQLQLSSGWATSDFGLGVNASRVRFPQLLREEFPGISDDEIRNSQTDRIGMNGWYRYDRDLRLRARVDTWNDEDSSGTSGELGASLRDYFYEGGEVSASVFANEGRFSTSKGLRLGASRAIPRGSVRFSYELNDIDQDGVDLLQHALTASLNRQLKSGWSVDLFVQGQLREEQNSIALGVSIQKGF